MTETKTAPESREYKTEVKQLLDILVCPVCKGKLQYDKKGGELICRADRPRLIRHM